MIGNRPNQRMNSDAAQALRAKAGCAGYAGTLYAQGVKNTMKKSLIGFILFLCVVVSNAQDLKPIQNSEAGLLSTVCDAKHLDLDEMGLDFQSLEVRVFRICTNNATFLSDGFLAISIRQSDGHKQPAKVWKIATPVYSIHRLSVVSPGVFLIDAEDRPDEDSEEGGYTYNKQQFSVRFTMKEGKLTEMLSVKEQKVDRYSDEKE